MDLEEAIASGRFRDDLMGRLEQRVVTLDRLDQRGDEIPMLIELLAKRLDPDAQIDGTFVEACLLASWPRNIRQLEAAVDNAASTARETKRAIVASDLTRPARPSFAPSPPEQPLAIDTDDRAELIWRTVPPAATRRLYARRSTSAARRSSRGRRRRRSTGSDGDDEARRVSVPTGMPRIR